MIVALEDDVAPVGEEYLRLVPWENSGNIRIRVPSRVSFPGFPFPTMNSLVQRFSTTGAQAELRKAQNLVEDGESSEAMWGSEAGFANLAHGIPSFAVPAVPDVRVSCLQNDVVLCTSSHPHS